MDQHHILKYQATYVERLGAALENRPAAAIAALVEELSRAEARRAHVFLIGNGGSAGNANHLANDLLYGLGPGRGLKADALSANPSVLTCLANDLSYERVFSEQLKVKASAGDVLIALSGSGNSANIVSALETGNAMGLKTFAILGYAGGRCLSVAQTAIHFPVDDMQICEDLQLVVGHLCTQLLRSAEPDR